MPKRIEVYKCYFKMNGQRMTVSSRRGLKAFKDGFWLNENYNLVEYVFGTEEDIFSCTYWIPPSNIDYLLIVREEV